MHNTVIPLQCCIRVKHINPVRNRVIVINLGKKNKNKSDARLFCLSIFYILLKIIFFLSKWDCACNLDKKRDFIKKNNDF